MENNKVDLRANSQQLIHAFIWVVFGVLIGGFFLAVPSFIGEANTGVLVIGGVTLGISVISGILEYRDLPGGQVEFGADKVTFTRRDGLVKEYGYGQISCISLMPGRYAKVSGREMAERGMTEDLYRYYPGRHITGPQAKRVIKRPNWYLFVGINSVGRKAGMHQLNWKVGGGLDKIFELQGLCQEHGVTYRQDEIADL